MQKNKKIDQEEDFTAPTIASALSIDLKVLVALRFFASGGYQQITGNTLFLGISQASVSRCIKEVCDGLSRNEILNQWVRFPRNQAELEEIRNRFYAKHQFPGVVGVIDCTHICDDHLRIMSVDGRFPGSSHDAHIWRQSNVSPIIEQVYRNNPQNLFFSFRRFWLSTKTLASYTTTKPAS
ncbi:hypothetical protein NQ314_005017 [Rhamnusium bicolor]|uniref:Nuclease HARBI1 n=1 Tax=Rhamnusium bicolor TaxID=1586634 RepID=A0AAV8ZKU8_9CUCU|nr:hypothetical protein NQ314_005017 [Rhamnusium bicolor]